MLHSSAKPPGTRASHEPLILPVMAVVLIVSVVSQAQQYTEKERRDTQRRLDEACEAARNVELEPLRRDIYKRCMERRNDESFCQADAEHYNGQRLRAAPMFYDLPECVSAFEYRKSHRVRR